jgi:hypothetical protein
MFLFINLMLGLMALFNVAAIATGHSPTIREIVGRMTATDDGRHQLQTALAMAVLVQIYLVVLVFPLKAISPGLGLTWSMMMLVSVLETVYTSRKMMAVLNGEDTSGEYPLHDSRWYLAYQIVYNMAIVGVCIILAIAPHLAG